MDYTDFVLIPYIANIDKASSNNDKSRLQEMER